MSSNYGGWDEYGVTNSGWRFIFLDSFDFDFFCLGNGGGRGYRFCKEAKLFAPHSLCTLILKNWSAKFYIIDQISIYFTWFSSIFLNFSTFFQTAEEETNILQGTNSTERLNYLVPSSIFQFKKFEWPKFYVVDQISIYSK